MRLRAAASSCSAVATVFSRSVMAASAASHSVWLATGGRAGAIDCVVYPYGRKPQTAGPRAGLLPKCCGRSPRYRVEGPDGRRQDAATGWVTRSANTPLTTTNQPPRLVHELSWINARVSALDAGAAHRCGRRSPHVGRSGAAFWAQHLRSGLWLPSTEDLGRAVDHLVAVTPRRPS